MENLEALTPREIVARLDIYIIGQNKAKRAVAIALRNRTRRLRLPEDVRDEIAPKNILMIGPTGVGKTEIARRLAKLCSAPFIKVEATKYTEVGYVGRDVESMVRDLMAVGFNMVKAEMQEKIKEEAGKQVEEALLDLLLPGSGKVPPARAPFPNVQALPVSGGASITIGSIHGQSGPAEDTAREEVPQETQEEVQESVLLGDQSAGSVKNDMNSTREKLRVMLRDGRLDERVVEVQVQRRQQMPAMEIFAGGNMEDLESSMAAITNMITGGKSRKKSVTVREARDILLAEHLDKMTDPDKVADEARKRVQEIGIIFIDEIDKIAVRGERGGGQDVSREGVQRDILPIVEGSTVNTKYGVVDTTHILFIAAGAFSVSKPSDLIPELQGRFPLRVELESLNTEDFRRILLEPKNALTSQYRDLMSTEDVTIRFTDEAIDRMSALAAEVNSRMENIGARRLHTIMETLLEELSFNASELSGQTIDITAEYVDERLKDVVQDQDLSRYIL